MMIQPITLDMRGHDPIIKDPNIANMGPIPCITISVSAANICTWIISRGGWNNLTIFDIMTLVSAYLGQTNLGFPITIANIIGGVAYYLNNPSSGNSSTGCSFI